MRTECIHCGAIIETDFGIDAPAEHMGAQGTEDEPRSPGDYDNICDVCNYAHDLRGGPYSDYPGPFGEIADPY